MTGWLIFLGVILFILGVLMIPVHAEGYYKEEFSLKIRCLFFLKFTILPAKEKEKKKEEKPKEKKTAEEKPAEKKEKRKMTVEEIVDMIVHVVEKYGPGAKMILRNIRFHRLEFYWKVGAEDAAACGIKYGRACAWISGVLGFFRNLMRIEKTKLKVFPDFICEEDERYGGFDLELNPLIVIIGALRMAAAFLGDLIKSAKEKPKNNAVKHKIKVKESA